MIGTKEVRSPARHTSEFQMARQKKPNTLVVRLHEDVAMLADKIASALGKTTPDFLSDTLRPILEQMKSEAAQKIIDFPLDDHDNKKPRKK